MNSCYRLVNCSYKLLRRFRDYSQPNYLPSVVERCTNAMKVKAETELEIEADDTREKQISLRDILFRETQRLYFYLKRLKKRNASEDEINKTNNELEDVKKQLLDLCTSQGLTYPQKFILRPPKGTRDYDPEQMTVRNRIVDEIVTVFKRHGAVTIDTPVLELKEVLTGKYGEDSKLIYDLAVQENELLSLRYDLTVPFARYIQMNKIRNMKRYQIGKAYRRDEPVTTRARFREFLQCDFDIAGRYDPMLPEVECVRISCEILTALNLENFRVRVNHRSLLDGLFEVCKIDTCKFRSICSAIDKLDRETWENVRKEMITEKGLSEAEADKIGKYISRNGREELVETLLADEFLHVSDAAKHGLENIKLFLKYCSIYQISSNIVFDLSLARGLDYYTGLIYEVELESMSKDESVGAVAAGGRYDNLVGMFDRKNRKVPCVGLSIGVERLFSVIEAKNNREGNKIRVIDTQVYVASAQKNFLEERMKICCELWNNKINAEISYKTNPKLLPQLHYCESNQIPFAVIVGESELKKNVLKIRDISSRKEVEVPRDHIVEELSKMLQSL